MSRTIAWLANAALFVLCCLMVADTANAVIAALLTPTVETSAPAPTAPETSRRTWADRQVILSRNLFNASLLSPEPEAVAVPDEDLEATRLPLTLLGTAAAADPALSWAAVEDREKRKTLVVKVQDAIRPQATVLRIERRRVVLLENGSPRELAIEEEEGAPIRRASAPAPRPRARSSAMDNRVRRLAQDRFSVPRSEVREAARNPASLFSQARIVPKYDDGTMVGVQVNAIKPGSIFEEIGIENGDVITELNGIQIQSPEDSAKLLSEFTDSSQFDVVVESGGETRTLNFTVPEE